MFCPRVAESYWLSRNLCCQGIFFSIYAFFRFLLGALQVEFWWVFFDGPITRLCQSDVDRAGADADQWTYQQQYWSRALLILLNADQKVLWNITPHYSLFFPPQSFIVPIIPHPPAPNRKKMRIFLSLLTQHDWYYCGKVKYCIWTMGFSSSLVIWGIHFNLFQTALVAAST